MDPGDHARKRNKCINVCVAEDVRDRPAERQQRWLQRLP
jgi:hypothetical protein